MTPSAAINAAIAQSQRTGNDVLETSEGWDKLRLLVSMRERLDHTLRAVLVADTRLRHWVSEPTPHNAAQEGFSDDTMQVAIAFPC